MRRDGATESQAGKWTRSEDYLGAMARKRTFRRSRQRDRTQPEVPQMLLSTIPFLALLLLLGVLAVGIMVAAFPGSQPPDKAPQPAHKEQGFAPRGWLQEAQKEFHR